MVMSIIFKNINYKKNKGIQGGSSQKFNGFGLYNLSKDL